MSKGGKRDDMEAFRKIAAQTGFPLENDVEAQLGGLVWPGKTIMRPWPFATTNEDGDRITRTVDFRCDFPKAVTTLSGAGITRSAGETATLTVLLDAKYSDQAYYVFTPVSTAASLTTALPVLIPTYSPAADDSGPPPGFGEFASSYDRLASHRSGRVFHKPELLRLSAIADGWPVAERAIKFGDGDRRDSVLAQQTQVTGAVVAAMEDAARRIGESVDADNFAHYRNAHVFAPVIAVNGQLRMLKPGIGSAAIAAAETPDAICDVLPWVCLLPPDEHRMQALVRSAAQVTTRGGRQGYAWLNCSGFVCPTIYVTAEALPQLMQLLADRFAAALGLTG